MIARDEGPVAVSGDRPTGRLHLGHLMGTLEDRVRLQETHRCFFLVADLHFLTTHFDRTADLSLQVEEMVLDWISVGLDPARSIFVLQSRVPEIAELAVILSMLCPLPRARRLPAIKEKARGESPSLGLLSYPVLMAADVLLFDARTVSVGEDQLSHLELVRELARRFNRTYGPFFAEPEPRLGRSPRLVGTDGAAKMSKSLGNAIYLSDSPEEIARKVRGMYTDPARIRSDIPGTVENNPVFIYHELFNENAVEVQDLKERYRAGRVGDVEVKERLALALNHYLDPIRERRGRAEGWRGSIYDLLWEGSRRAADVGRARLEAILSRMRFPPRSKGGGIEFLSA